MELRQLELFVAIVEEGTVSAAAGRFHVAQSAASATLRKLERELGAELVERGPRGVTLTDAGAALLPEARLTLSAAEAAREAVDAVRGGLRGTVRLGIMQARRDERYSVPDLLRRFRASHPAVDVVIRHTGGSSQMAEHVAQGALDLAFVVLCEPGPPGVALTPLGSERMDLVCPATHPLARRKAVRLDELTGEPFVDLPLGWGTRAASERALAAAGTRRNLVYEVNDVSNVLDFVRSGLALALLPLSLAEHEPELVSVPVRPHPPLFELFLATPAGGRPTAAAAAFAALITGERSAA